MSVRIGQRLIGRGYPVFFIAELGINHNGSLPLALEMIESAKVAGAEAVKFQKRNIPIVYSADELAKTREVHPSIIENAMARLTIEGISYEVFPEENLRRLQSGGPTTNGDLKYALEFGPKEYDTINRRCVELGLYWSASCWDGLSAHFINGFEDVEWLKIASPCLTNRDLLERTKAKGKTIILSVGGSTVEQMSEAVRILGTDRLILLHCTSIYPPQDEEHNLLMLETLARIYPAVPIGYSSHAFDYLPPLASSIMGACVIEAHFTLDQNMPGSDHKASLNPAQFTELVRAVRRVESMRGDGLKRVWPDEVATMNKLRRVRDF